MKNARMTILVVGVLFVTNIASADIFGTGGNQFTIDFVNILGDSGDLGSWAAGDDYTFSGVNHGDYRMGTYEISNDQFAMFTANSQYWTGADVPANMVSWYEGAQFVNYLNTSTGHQAAYKFTDNTFSVWGPGDSGYDADNPYRNSNAHYFMPTEDEWVKAAYWNGTSLQTYATTDGLLPTAGVDINYDDAIGQPWDVGSGSEELNGTYNMMGNVWEWMESPDSSGDYLSGSWRSFRGGSWGTHYDHYLSSSFRSNLGPFVEQNDVGFRVASVPEPATLLLFGLGAVVFRMKRGIKPQKGD